MQKIDGKVRVGQMKTKTFFFFSNACLILEFTLCKRNLTKKVYQTLLSSDCRAWALKLNKHLKKQTNFHQSLPKKDINYATKKDHKSMSNFSNEQTHIFL